MLKMFSVSTNRQEWRLLRQSSVASSMKLCRKLCRPPSDALSVRLQLQHFSRHYVFRCSDVGSCMWLSQGKMLDDGCSSADYRITVGVGNCTVVDFSSNQITCEPPTYRPQANLSWIAFCDNSTSVLPLIVSTTRFIT